MSENISIVTEADASVGKIELNFKAVEMTKLDLKDGEVLAITIKSDDMDGDTIKAIRDGVNAVFPNNRVLIFGLSLGDEIRFSSVSEIK